MTRPRRSSIERDVGDLVDRLDYHLDHLDDSRMRPPLSERPEAAAAFRDVLAFRRRLTAESGEPAAEVDLTDREFLTAALSHLDEGRREAFLAWACGGASDSTPEGTDGDSGTVGGPTAADTDGDTVE